MSASDTHTHTQTDRQIHADENNTSPKTKFLGEVTNTTKSCDQEIFLKKYRILEFCVFSRTDTWPSPPFLISNVFFFNEVNCNLRETIPEIRLKPVIKGYLFPSSLHKYVTLKIKFKKQFSVTSGLINPFIF